MLNFERTPDLNLITALVGVNVISHSFTSQLSTLQVYVNCVVLETNAQAKKNDNYLKLINIYGEKTSTFTTMYIM